MPTNKCTYRHYTHHKLIQKLHKRKNLIDKEKSFLLTFKSFLESLFPSALFNELEFVVLLLLIKSYAPPYYPYEWHNMTEH